MRLMQSLGLIGLFAGLALTGLSPARADVETMMGVGVDLPGGDISNYALQSPDPGFCRLACDQNPQCQGWTFVKPGVQGPNAVCWIKGQVGAGVQNQNAISGTKQGGGGGPYPGGARVESDMMLGINLAGGDIASFALASGDPNLCRQACDARGDCRSWTFVKPGAQGPQAMCWLKGSVPGGTFHNGVISGVKGQGGGGGGGAGGAGGGGPGGGAWGVWAYRGYGSSWGDPCAIQYVASPIGNARYAGNPQMYVLVRTRDSQRDADLDIHEFSLFHKNQPDGVVKTTVCPTGANGGGAGNGGTGGGGAAGGGGDYRAWMTGTFDSSGGVLQLTPAGGTYEYRQGTMRVTRIEGTTMEGIWTQNMSAGQCANGAYYGRFRLRFTEEGFTGVFGYCEEEPYRTGSFFGTRRK